MICHSLKLYNAVFYLFVATLIVVTLQEDNGVINIVNRRFKLSYQYFVTVEEILFD